jgi:cell division protein FtsI/penicillin-binding protein 2
MVLFLIAAGIIIGRLTVIQIVKGEQYAALSKTQSVERKIVPAPRGRLLDRQGEVMAKAIEGALSVATNDATAGHARVAVSSSGVSLQGATKEAYRRRVYPMSEVTGAFCGYVGRDGYGLGGLEYAMDEYLRGENGWTIMRCDGRNNTYASVAAPHRLPTAGCDVYTTIQADIQRIAHNVLREAVEDCGAQGGMCVVMDPYTGEVLAMTEMPAFDPNRAMHYPRTVRQCRNVGYNYEPGSTFKVVTAAAALETGTITPDQTIDGDQGRYQIYNDVITDRKPFGVLSFTEALAYSCNVCFAKAGDRLGNETLYRFFREFGFGAKTGIQLPGEEKGQLKPVQRWSGRTGVTMSIGQGLSVTLMQMMSAFCCVANGGVLMKPTIVHTIEDVDGKEHYRAEPVRVRRVISERTAQQLRLMMRQVVTRGTGRHAAIRNVTIAGKTGTSQKYDAELGKYSNTKCWASFIGFAPLHRPRLVCGVVIDEPAEGQGGGVVAAPAFKKIMAQILSNPDLQYAEAIIDASTPRPASGGNTAAATATAKRRQTDASTVLSLATRSSRTREGVQEDGIRRVQRPDKDSVSVVEMPDCIGKSVRNSVNEINIRGLVPFLSGTGAHVVRQIPSPGQAIQKTSICTLYCDTRNL